MDNQTKGVIGILGGMGPDATITLFHRIVALTDAQKDQDHFRIIIDNNPTIPDRTEALLGRGQSPVSQLQASAQRLQAAGAQVIGMPCNTAHAFFLEIEKTVSIPFLNMVKITQKKTEEQKKKTGKPFFLLATRGTVNTGVFSGLKIPEEKVQKKVQALIYKVKKGGGLREQQEELLEIINQIQEKSEGVVLGCTELSFLFWPPYNEKIKGQTEFIIDPLDLLAKELIKFSRTL